MSTTGQSPASVLAAPRRVLIVATAALPPDDMARTLSLQPGDTIYLIAPILQAPLQFYTNDDRARVVARTRLEAWLAALRGAGLDVDGEVGADDPVQSVEDGVIIHAPIEVILATGSTGDAAWLERGAAQAARQRVSVPVRHVIVERDGGTSERESGLAGTTPSRDHGTRELLLLIVTGLLAMMGSGFWFLGGAILPTEQLVLYAILIDVVPKALFVSLVWRFHLGRGHERRR